ncbi:uncharacterized protein IWZ02DRAFT_12865 [Phyllosticta citriasiana]|uniref:uncharacterized protein n=1 Tax=Phyllosticta citriasiana TaxID=595635 RepID=UPI0030FD9E23
MCPLDGTVLLSCSQQDVSWSKPKSEPYLCVCMPQQISTAVHEAQVLARSRLLFHICSPHFHIHSHCFNTPTDQGPATKKKKKKKKKNLQQHGFPIGLCPPPPFPRLRHLLRLCPPMPIFNSGRICPADLHSQPARTRGKARFAPGRQPLGAEVADMVDPGLPRESVEEADRRKTRKGNRRQEKHGQVAAIPTAHGALVHDRDCLDAAGVMAIRAASLMLRDRLGAARADRKATVDEVMAVKAQMRRWMIQQLYPKLCERERRVGAKLKRPMPYLYLLCQPCAARHPFTAFSHQQVKAGPEKRRCHAQERVFHICEHMAVDLNTMKYPINRVWSKKTPSAMWNNLPGRLYCDDCPKRPGTARFGFLDVDRAILYDRPILDPGSKFYYRTRIMSPEKVLELPDIARLSQDLASDDTSICPHVSIKDLDFERCKSRKAYVLPDADHSLCGGCTRCPATFAFKWKKDPVRMVLEMHCELNVNKDPSTWLAISKPSCLSDAQTRTPSTWFG